VQKASKSGRRQLSIKQQGSATGDGQNDGAGFGWAVTERAQACDTSNPFYLMPTWRGMGRRCGRCNSSGQSKIRCGRVD
jgi:hypothetical protein